MKKLLLITLLFFGSITFSQSEPDGFPGIDITVKNHPSPGTYLFALYTMSGIQSTPILIEMNQAGEYSFFRQMGKEATDFKLQPNGCYTWYDGETGGYLVMNHEYKIIDTIYAYRLTTNNHELVMFPKGGYILLADDIRIMDMSGIVPGGKPNATVVANVIQEFDEDNNLVFMWNGFDYFSFSDAASDVNLTASYIDFIHSNSIEIDTDGNILLCSRNVDEVTKIDRRTGKILWRWGGKNNQFTFINDPRGFSHQHDVRRLENGNILMFDNGNNRYPSYSRVVEYKLDEVKKTATLVWQYRHIPDIYSPAMGNARRMPDGNTFIGWGFNSSYATGMYSVGATEVDSLGNVVLEIKFPDYHYSYRVFHYDGKVSSPGLNTISSVRGDYNNKSGFGLSLYPNPVTGNASVAFTLDAPEKISIMLYDALGREVRTIADEFCSETYGETVLNTTGLPSGIYYLRMQTKDKIETIKASVIK